MAINSSSFLIATLFGNYSHESESIVFVGRQGYISWTWKPKLMVHILMNCNGYTTIKEIALKLNQTNRLIITMLRQAESFGIVQEATDLYYQLHDDSRNPTVFASTAKQKLIREIHDRPLPWSPYVSEGFPIKPATATPLSKTVNKRLSCRQFVPGHMSKEMFSSLLAQTYSVRSVPSAGDLRSIMPYIYLFQQIENIPKGLYEYRWEKQELFFLEHQPTRQQLMQAFPEEHLFYNTLCVVVFTSDISRVALKYGNRSYRYVHLEAGHAAQNIYLWGAEHDMGVLEYGGYLDRELARTLGHEKQTQLVLTSLFIGKPSLAPQTPCITTSKTVFETLSSKYINREKLIEQVELLSLPNQISCRSYANAIYSIGDNLPKQLSWGNGQNLYEAQFKAIMEGVERSYSTTIRVDYECPANDLRKNWLDPRTVAPLSKEQYRLFPNLQPFDPTIPWQWVSGRYWKTGKMVLVPIDLVYYPINPKPYNRRLCCYTTSSGVAAHSTLKQAVTGGLLELIERDAFVLTWYVKRKVTRRINMALLQDSPLADYTQGYFKQGVDVVFLTINQSGKTAVVLCLMREQNNYGKLGIGAGASFVSFVEAAEKAFYEAECVFLTQPEQPVVIKSMQAVQSVSDHLHYYQHSSRQSILERWLPESVTDTLQISDSVDNYDPIVVDLYTTRSLKVVRVIEPSLVPLSFGYGLEYYKHPHFQQALSGDLYRFPGKPHCFA